MYQCPWPTTPALLLLPPKQQQSQGSSPRARAPAAAKDAQAPIRSTAGSRPTSRPMSALPPAVRGAACASGLTAYQLTRLAKSPMVLAVAQQVREQGWLGCNAHALAVAQQLLTHACIHSAWLSCALHVAVHSPLLFGHCRGLVEAFYHSSAAIPCAMCLSGTAFHSLHACAQAFQHRQQQCLVLCVCETLSSTTCTPMHRPWSTTWSRAPETQTSLRSTLLLPAPPHRPLGEGQAASCGGARE